MVQDSLKKIFDTQILIAESSIMGSKATMESDACCWVLVAVGVPGITLGTCTFEVAQFGRFSRLSDTVAEYTFCGWKGVRPEACIKR